jgi:pimeloyl-ACP methyl ester carboxylesterase
VLAAAEARQQLVAELIADWAHARFPAPSHPVPGSWPAAGTIRLLERALDGTFAADLAAAAAYADGLHAASRVRCPTLVILGSEDRAVPPSLGRRLAKAIQGARVVELAAGHQLTAEQPDQVTDALLEAL